MGFERGTREMRGSPTSRLTFDSPLLTLHSPSLRVVAGKSGVAWVSEKVSSLQISGLSSRQDFLGEM